MSQIAHSHGPPLHLKRLAPDAVRQHLARDGRLIVPVGKTEQHGPHLPLGVDTIIVERLADDLSAEFQVLRAPTIEYGVNTPTATSFPGSASLTRKTLHRVLNDLVAAWEAGGVTRFIILAAHGGDPHQEALSTFHLRNATVRTVDVSAALLGAEFPVHGGEADTSLLLYLDRDLVWLDRARDYPVTKRISERYLRGQRRAIPADAPGSLGYPTRASVENGERLYHLVYDRIANRVFRAG